jgi:putative tryptophan/tyrosine transport system substrate-binding protein
LSAILLTMAGKALAAGTGQIPILILSSHNMAPYTDVVSSFERHLGKCGIDAVIEKHWMEGDAGKSSEFLDRAVKGGYKGVLTLGSVATAAARGKITDIPVVAGLILDMDDIKEMKNAVGVLMDFPPQVQFEWMKRLIPNGKNVGILYSPQKNQQKIEIAVSEARSMGMNLYARKIEKPSDIPGALEDLVNKVDFLWGLPDPVVYTPQTAKHILLFSLESRIPLIGLSEVWVKAGALFALNVDNDEVGTQCAEAMAATIQKGKAAVVSPLFPHNGFYSLNLKTAEQMKISVPEGIIRGAREVFR